MLKDYTDAGLPLMGHCEDRWIHSAWQTPAEQFFWSTNPCVIPYGRWFHYSLNRSVLKFHKQCHSKGRGKAVKQSKHTNFPWIWRAGTICVGNCLASEHCWVLQTSFHLQPAFDHLGTVHSIWGFVFLPLPAHSLLLHHPLPISTPPQGRTRKEDIDELKEVSKSPF